MARQLIRFGVICDGSQLRAWEVKCIHHLLAIADVELSLVVVHQRERIPDSLPRKLRHAFSRQILYRLAHEHLFRSAAIFRSAATEPVDARELFDGLPLLECKLASRGDSRYFPDSDLAAISDARLDFLLRFGVDLIREEPSGIARFGIWSFHHDDEQRYRGQPPCFWEIYRGDEVTGSVLKRLTKHLDEGIVLHKGFFKTFSDSYTLNRDQALLESSEWPARICRDIKRGETGYLDGPRSATTAPI